MDMNYMLIRHRVKDFAKWKMIFDAAYPVRKSFGEKNCRVFRNADDPNDVTVLMEWDDLQKALRYSQSEDLKMGMKAAGVVGEPVVYVENKDMEC
jgi:hypothetical protein